jgi:hypothetical protein
MKKGKKISFETISKEYCKANNCGPYTGKSINEHRLHIEDVIVWIDKNPYKYYIDTETATFYRASKDSIREYEKEVERKSSRKWETDPATVEYIMVI